jgi:hypothetical protein
MDHSYQSWTADPDGNPMELMEYTHASPQVQRTSPEKPLVIGG